MRPTRRSVLQAAAAVSTVSMWPVLGRGASASPGERVDAPLEVDATGLTGISMSWFGVRHTPVAVIEARIDDAWTSGIEVVADHGHGPDDPAGRERSAPVLRPSATAYRITPRRGVDATDLRVHRIAAGPAPLSVAADALDTVSPIAGLHIIRRDAWSLRPRLDAYDCAFGSSVYGAGCRSDIGLRHGVIHHTVNDNQYTEAEVPALLRGIQTEHIDNRGWDDIGYNFVVDRFGRIWQARDADLYEPIVGGHTLGLNAESVGVAVLGTFTDADPGQPVIDALSRLLGWKCSLHGVDPLGSVVVRSNGNEFTDFGERVAVETISGHRDNQATSCPGSALYERIGEVRIAAAELVPLFGDLTPRYFDDRIEFDGWVISRFDPTAVIEVDVEVDGEPWKTLSADLASDAVATAHPEAGSGHGFDEVVPITIDTRSITVTARALDGTTTSLMDLTLFATFIDVEPDRFFAPGIYFLKANCLTAGKRAGLYEPMDVMTRAEMATFLWRFMGEPAADRSDRFDDVDDGTWYTTPVDWLAASGITIGTSPTTFSPEDPVTRGQMATFLWRLCGRQPSTATTPFTDVATGAFYSEPVRWLYDLGITVGTTPTTYSPDGIVTRGEIATFLHRLARTPEAWTITDRPPALVD
ncbi:MAG: S-layer homology domain-containing protein [Actinomycetota bacterium]